MYYAEPPRVPRLRRVDAGLRRAGPRRGRPPRIPAVALERLGRPRVRAGTGRGGRPAAGGDAPRGRGRRPRRRRHPRAGLGRRLDRRDHQRGPDLARGRAAAADRRRRALGARTRMDVGDPRLRGPRHPHRGAAPGLPRPAAIAGRGRVDLVEHGCRRDRRLAHVQRAARDRPGPPAASSTWRRCATSPSRPPGTCAPREELPPEPEPEPESDFETWLDETRHS
jgi:hypothetical protein